MDQRWRIRSVDIRGGFLDGASIAFPAGLTCIIGPRGTGKSTLAEAIRYALTGNDRADKQRRELFQSNLSHAVITVTSAITADGNAYVIRREARQPALVATAAGAALQNVDLDRGTFLPLDGYSSKEVEDIADEAFAGARRALVDDLEPGRMPALRDVALRALRALQSNADEIRSCRRERNALIEEHQTLAHVRAVLAGLPEPDVGDVAATRMQAAARQASYNATEKKALATATQRMKELSRELSAFAQRAAAVETPVSVAASLNLAITSKIDDYLRTTASSVEARVSEMERILQAASSHLTEYSAALEQAHRRQEMEFAELKSENALATEAARQRAQAEADVHRLETVEQDLTAIQKREERLLNERRHLRRDYNVARDAISGLREEIARRLESQAGERVKITVRRNADKLAYRQLIENALKGASLRQHDVIVEKITASVRPDELAQIVTVGNSEELDRIGDFGAQRSQKILEGIRHAIDPLDVETVELDDEIAIELDVGTDTQPLLKDASQLSRGQKCTALLPLLLARRDAPVVIDQPEDNLDNHFIFNTVVETIRRLKTERQMVFITHNANIPVLGEADLVIVMDSDGKNGFISKSGTLDDCKAEIIDLLEGGRAAFEMRRKRYEST